MPTLPGCRRRNSSFPGAIEKKGSAWSAFLSHLYCLLRAATLRSVNAIEQHFTLYSIGLIAHRGGRMRLFERLQRYAVNRFLVRSYACFILCVALCPVLLADAGTVLRDGWKVQSSAKVSASPEQISAAGRAQGIALVSGKGRVVVLGEANMISALLGDPPGKEPIGMNYPGTDNKQLALNIMHWLSGLL